jgi:peptidoglycan/LPS O-acetylase OafA/YrhL
MAELDGVRAIAVLLVILCHYPAFAAVLGGLLKSAWFGVDFFFVLSGFLITTVLLGLKGRPHAYRTFYLRRTARILPPYLVLVVVVLSLHVLLGGTIEIPLVRQLLLFLRSFVQTPTILANVAHHLDGAPIPSLFARPLLAEAGYGYVPETLGKSFAHVWSLSIEEWFYIGWAPIVLLLGRRSLVIVIALVSVVSFLVRWLGFAPTDWYFDFVCRVDTLALGAGLALFVAWRRGQEPATAQRADRFLTALALASSIVLAALLAFIGPVVGREVRDSVAFAAFFPPLLGVITASAIAWLVRQAGSSSLACRILRSRPAAFVGRRSYTIYLVHPPIIFAVTYGVGYLPWATELASVALCLVVAAASWRWLEQPLLRRAGAGAPTRL